MLLRILRWLAKIEHSQEPFMEESLMPRVGQLYRHHRTQDLYRVMAIGKIKADGAWGAQPLVSYQSVTGKVFHRYVNGFMLSFSYVRME